jgi:ABC-type transport system substrate-binding protein
MRRVLFSQLAILALVQFISGIVLCSPSLAQDWKLRGHRGTLKVVSLFHPYGFAAKNYAEQLVALDKDNNFVPCLARDWRWIDDRTIEFKLRGAVRFHNGEKSNAEAVRVNCEAYRSMETPRFDPSNEIPDETIFEIIDDYKVRFTFPEPDGLALLKFSTFSLYEPAFFREHMFEEGNWGFLPEPGLWAGGHFKLVDFNPF